MSVGMNPVRTVGSTTTRLLGLYKTEEKIREIPLPPSTSEMPAKKQILVLVSAEQHRDLTAKAGETGVSIQTLIRQHFDRIKVAESRALARRDQLFLARIGTQLEIVVEKCRSLDDKKTVLEIIGRLIGIEREVHAFNGKRRAA